MLHAAQESRDKRPVHGVSRDYLQDWVQDSYISLPVKTKFEDCALAWEQTRMKKTTSSAESLFIESSLGLLYVQQIS